MLLSRSSKDLLGNICGPPNPSRDRSSSASTVESSPARRPSVDATADAIAAALSGRKASDLHVPSSEGDLHVDAPPNFERKSSVLIERRPSADGAALAAAVAAAVPGVEEARQAAAAAPGRRRRAGRRAPAPSPPPSPPMKGTAPADGAVVLGLDLGATSIKACVTDGAGAAVGAVLRAPLADWSFEAVVAQLAAVADEAVGAAGVDGWDSVRAVGLSQPGQVDGSGRNVVAAANFQHGRTRSTRDALEAHLATHRPGLHVSLIEDSNAALLAELQRGSGESGESGESGSGQTVAARRARRRCGHCRRDRR